MAGCAVINDTCMIKHCGYETTHYMTDIAVLGGQDMTDIFAYCAARTVIVTGITSLTHNIRAAMVYKSIGEIDRVMAGSTILGRVLMDSCIGLSSCVNRHEISIMTRRTVTADTCMSKNRGGKSLNRVAEGAILNCRQVIH